jgi:hypothetical protein
MVFFDEKKISSMKISELDQMTEARLCHLAKIDEEVALIIWQNKSLRNKLTLESMIDIAEVHRVIADFITTSPELRAELDTIHWVKLARHYPDMADEYWQDREVLDEECISVLCQAYPQYQQQYAQEKSLLQRCI